jgi:2-oxo-4-hydroxy-4-carboxy-5-ureidoimidazoline decarboxylase
MNNTTTLSLKALNNLQQSLAINWFSQCCAAPNWCLAMAQARPFSDKNALKQAAIEYWENSSEQDILTAFEAHPMIGDVNSLREKYAATKNMASNEQQGANDADDETLTTLAEANHTYLAKHGFIFIICASGLSARTMLASLTLRLKNDTDTEIVLAAEQQINITLLRFDKNLESEK